MTGTLSLRNCQRVRTVDLRLLRRIIRYLLGEHFRPASFDLGLQLVAAPEMAQLHNQFLGHAGSTDVITFDYGEPDAATDGVSPDPEIGAQPIEYGSNRAGRTRPVLHGEIVVCLDEAVVQARRFRTTWPAELVRYVIHGLLHLQGYDDLHPAARRRMKHEENRLLTVVSRHFVLARLRMPQTKRFSRPPLRIPQPAL